MNVKNSLGWVLLAVALAVPAFMFWNWWASMNTRGGEFKKKGSPQGVFSGGGAPADRLSNPILTNVSSRTVAQMPLAKPATFPAGSSFPAGNAPAGTIPPTAVPSRPAVVVGAAAPPARSGEATSLPANKPVAVNVGGIAGAAGGVGKAGAAVARSSRTAAGDDGQYHPKTDRDPTLSPSDIKKLADQTYQSEMAMRNAKGASDRAHKRRAEPSIESRLNVIGIINVEHSAPTAILYSGQIIKQGQIIWGAKVVRIATNSVTFKYKNKTIMKRVTK